MSHGTKGNGVDPLDDGSARALPAFPRRFILNPGRANVARMSRFTVHGHNVYAEYHSAGKKKTAVALADVLLHSEDSIKKIDDEASDAVDPAGTMPCCTSCTSTLFFFFPIGSTWFGGYKAGKMDVNS